MPTPPPQPRVNGLWGPIVGGRYTIDYSKTPIVLTLQARGPENQMQAGAGMLRFGDQNTMFIVLGQHATVLDEPHGAKRWVRGDQRAFPRP